MDNDHLLARLSVSMSHSFFRTLAQHTTQVQTTYTKDTDWAFRRGVISPACLNLLSTVTTWVWYFYRIFVLSLFGTVTGPEFRYRPSFSPP